MALEEAASLPAPLTKPAGRAVPRPTLDLQQAPARDGGWLVRPLLLGSALFSGLVVGVVVAFVIWRSWGLWHAEGVKFLTTGGWDQQLQDAWNGSATFGASELIAGTALSTVGAVLIALIVGLGAAIFVAELCPRWLRRPVEASIQLMAGIPSVVFGLVGLAVVVPLLMDHAIPGNAGDVMPDIPLDGTSLLAGVIVLTFMILPFFVTVAVDALRAVPRAYVDGGMALGMTRWRATTRLQLPAATPGLVAGIVLAASRGIGEAIAMSMVAGSLALIPTPAHGPLLFALQPIRTVASAIVDTGADASDVPSIASAMFALAAVLLVLSLALSLAARGAFSVFSRRMSVVSDRRV
jgi:phosphate transport system permease protein